MKGKVKRLDVPKYYHITQDGHDWYTRSWSDFRGVGSYAIWCEEHKDFHTGVQIDPLTMPESAQQEFAKTPPPKDVVT